MSPSLPPRPSLEQLRTQAKELLKAHRAGDRTACDALRLLHRFKDATEDDILAADVKLDDCQFAVAMNYGFQSWAKLKAHVEAVRGRPRPANVRREDGKVWIEGVPELVWGQSGGLHVRGGPGVGTVGH